MMLNRRSAIKVNDADLLCKNNCGFYGNPSWHYYCSVCYRNVYLKNAKIIKNSNQLDLSQLSVSSFTKFEEKRKVVATKGSNAMKKIFKINKDIDLKQDNCDALESKAQFDFFLGTLKKIISNDVMKQVKVQLDTLEEAKYEKIEQYSVSMQKFYEQFIKRMETDMSYKGISEELGEQILEEVEKYLSIQIYEWAFKPNFSNDEIKDLELQKRIRSLYWITPSILDAAVDEENAEEKVHFDEALTAMIEMNTHLCPRNKLDCIVRCCKSVFEAINAHCRNISPKDGSSMRLINADDFLPALILVLIRANPTLLHSNIQFIMRFTRPSLINSGENGYMFTNMSIAVEFINTLDYKSLNMTEQQFSDAMKGIKPVKLANDVDKGKEEIYSVQNIFDNNAHLLKELNEKEEILRVNLIQLGNDTKSYESLFLDTLDSMKRDVPLTLTVDYIGDLDHDLDLYRKSRLSWDKIDSAIQNSLPAPLLPNRSDMATDKANWELFLQ